MSRNVRWIGLTALLLVALLAVPAAGAGPRVPDTVGGTPPLLTPQESSGPRPLNTGLLYKISLDIGDLGFEVYDPATDTWTPLTPYETGAQMAVSAAGQLYAYGFNTGTIDVYDPATDTWGAVNSSPPGASGNYGNLEITNAGEFLYAEPWGNTLWYTVGGVWNTMALPFNCDAMGDYDPTTDQYVLGEAFTTNAHWIDLNTWTITDYFSGVGNGEYSRFSVVLDNMYFFEAGGSPIHYFDLANPAAPPVDTGTTLSWYSSAAADRTNHDIYVASLDGTQLWVYNPASNTALPLSGGSYGYHSSLAFTGVGAPPPDTLTCGTILAQPTFDPFGRLLMRWKVEAIDQFGAIVPMVMVDADLTWPTGGPASRTRHTQYNGYARFPWGSNASGLWMLDVTTMTLAGYTFADGANCSASTTW